MTSEELRRLYHLAYRQFYARPGVIWRRLRKSIRSRLEFTKSLQGLRALAVLAAQEAGMRLARRRDR